MSANPPVTIRYSHDAMVDMIVATPGISQGAIARAFGYTEAWVSTIMCSDAFRERLAARRAELIDPVILASVKDRMEAMTLRSLEILQEKLAQPALVVDPELALKAAALGAKGMGIGGFSSASAPSQQSVPPGEDRLARLADRLTLFIQQKRERIANGAEIETVEILGESRTEVFPKAAAAG